MDSFTREAIGEILLKNEDFKAAVEDTIQKYMKSQEFKKDIKNVARDRIKESIRRTIPRADIDDFVEEQIKKVAKSLMNNDPQLKKTLQKSVKEELKYYVSSEHISDDSAVSDIIHNFVGMAVEELVSNLAKSIIKKAK